jgi:hypothetical protein
MDYFAGLDVSVKETSVCIVDDVGKIVREVKVASEPKSLLAALKNPAYRFKRIGLEAGTAVAMAVQRVGRSRVECDRPARVLYARYFSDRIWFFSCRNCAGITYQSTMGHRWDRSARRIEKLRARLEWQAGGAEPLRPRGMHKRTYQRILGMLAYHEAIRKHGASYARKYRPDEHRAHLWRQCRTRFAELGGWPVR